MTQGPRSATSVEGPPTSVANITQWAEDIIDYLLRMNQDKQRQIDDLTARVEALETP